MMTFIIQTRDVHMSLFFKPKSSLQVIEPSPSQVIKLDATRLKAVRRDANLCLCSLSPLQALCDCSCCRFPTIHPYLVQVGDFVFDILREQSMSQIFWAH